MLINNIKRCFHLNCSHTTDEMKIRRGKKNININEAGPVLFSDWFLINSVNKVSGVMTGMCRCVLSPRIGSNLDSLHRIECNLWWSFWCCWIRNQGQCCIYLQTRNYIWIQSEKKILPSKQKSHDCHCICVMPVQLTSKITNNFMEVDYNVRIVNINADRNSSTSILKL